MPFLPEIDLDFLLACLKEAGQLAVTQRGCMTADIKADLTPVTDVDRQVETFLIERISQRYPGHIILSEETGLRTATADFAWVIDPIDGTRSFASGLPVWGVSIGVLRRGEPYVGGLYLPVTGETYWGTRQQAFYNDSLLAPVTNVDPDNVLNFLGVPSNFHLYFEVSFPRIRSLGSTAAHLAYVASGASVGTLMHTTSLWDIAGLLPSLAATGIELAYLSGRPFDPAALLDGKPIREPLLAAHPSLMETLCKCIRGK